MACGINVIAVIVACATLASADHAPFPHGKTTVYNYRTTVKTTTNDESRYSSQFVVQGTLDVTHDTRDPSLTNAYNVVLSNVVTDMHNGKTVDYDGKPVLQSIGDGAKVIEEPFLIIYNENGTLQAVKIGEREPKWSKHMKMAMAAMLQLELPEINVEKLTNEPLTFTAQEKTMYGHCSVAYEVHLTSPEEFRVNKTFSPIDCDGFEVQEFNNVDNDHCKAKKPEQMSTASWRDVDIAKHGEGMLIKKLVAHSFVRVLPANGASYPHYVITNTNFEFLQTKDKSDKDSLGNFVTVPKIHELHYRKPRDSAVPNAAVDVTQGRHLVILSRLPAQLDKLLSDAVNYLEESHFSPSEMNWDHAQTMNKILHTMREMTTIQLEGLFDVYGKSNLHRNTEIRNIFLGVAAQVGTPASCHFTRNVIMKNKISPLAAVDMLTKLPLSVKVPTTELLAEMEDLMKLDPAINVEVRKAGILSFASLIYRTFKNVPYAENSPIFHKYIQDFFNGLREEKSYDMKVVYMMAIKNIQVGKIYNHLEPLITGDQDITPDPDRFQLLAIWAMDKSVVGDYPSATRILWPIMANETLPTKLRIAAYEILMNQAPDEESARKVHDYVGIHGNNHFYYYHYTTLDSIARSADKCKHDLRAIARAILKETDFPKDSRKDFHYPLSGVHTVNYVGSSFIFGSKVEFSTVVNELTGDIEVLKLEHESLDNDGAVSDLSIQMHIEGPINWMDMYRYFPRMRGTKVVDILNKAQSSLPATKMLKVDVVLMRSGQVFVANHYDFQTLMEMTDYMMEYYYNMTGTEIFNYQNVVFDRLYEKQVPSDIGVPITVNTRIPAVTSLQLNHTNIIKAENGFDLDIEFKSWIHGDHSMAVYNPMKDVWHAIRSSTLSEISLPFHSRIIPDSYPDILKFRFEERPGAPPAVAGLVIRGKHMVTVDEEGTEKLKESCSTCLNQEDFHDGKPDESDDRQYRETIYFSKSLGLRAESYMYRPKYGFTPDSSVDQNSTWDEPFESNITSSWMDVLSESTITAHFVWEMLNYEAQRYSNGVIVKIEPSANHSFSEINISLRGKMEDYDKNQTNLERGHAMLMKRGVTFNTISSATNTSAGSFDIDLEFYFNQGHLSNKGALRITRKGPGEQNFKVCVDANKNYPIPPSDQLKLGETKEEIDSKWTLAYGYTDDEECPRNQSLLTFNVKAQLSEEQKVQLKEDLENSACSRDTKNPLYSNPKNLVPRTINCLNEAIKYTTPRKYTVDVTHKQLTPDFAAFIYHFFTARREPREEESFQFSAEFPMTTNTIDLRLMTNDGDIKDRPLHLRYIRGDDYGPEMKPYWDFPLDNSRFGLKFLWNYISDDIRLCSVYPGIIDRHDDYPKALFTIPSDSWVLLSGDHQNDLFAVFGKQERPDYLSIKVFVLGLELNFFTRESDNVLVAMGEGLVPETGDHLPGPQILGPHLKITRDNDHFVVRMPYVPVTLRIGSNYIVIAQDSDLQGHVSGLCGHLDGRPLSRETDVYSTNDLDSN